MTPERWQQVKGIFDRAIACEAASRDAFVREACAGDEELLDEVDSLLGSYATAGTFFDKPVVASMTPAARDPMIGRTFGVYRIVREIGRGGMGSVYLASRIDDQIRRRVALKAIKPELADEHTLRRFQNERQTLAVLDHPNIIKLLDGGQSEDGLPYLVMDYVEGQPIDEYCASHKLSIPERLELFRTVCGAVHYAHQNLVVHRDLKPTNILVTPDGAPKLLDFGIAKLLRPEYSAQAIGITRTRLQPMTPKYASPEQVMGQPVTTASDVYALGVLLYELLTGHHPFERQGASELELEKAIVSMDPEKPSIAVTHADAETEAMLQRFQEGRPETVSRLLSGDLDMIVLMAMRKEPQRRYASAEHLAEDVRRHAQGLPVVARKSTMQYRLGKFVRRHKLGVAAGALIAATLVGSGIAVYRSELRAEQMFADLRRYNHFLLTDVDKTLLAEGRTPARELMSEQVVNSLDRLARAAKDDPDLQRDLIDANVHMGDSKGNFFVGNLGGKAKAADSYRRALSIAESLLKAHPQDIALRRQMADIYGKLADVSPNRKAMLEQYRAQVQLYESLPLNDRGVQTSLLGTWMKMSSIQEQIGDPDGALETSRRCLQFAREKKRDAQEKVCHERTAYFMALAGDTTGAEDAIRDSLRFFEKNDRKREEAQVLTELAEVQKRTGKIGEAIASMRRSAQITAEVLAEDPKDQLSQSDYAHGMVILIHLLRTANQAAEERAETARALRTIRPWLDQPDVSDYPIQDYVEILVTTPYAEFQDRGAALEYARKAVSMTQDADPNALDMLARAYHLNGDDAHAAETEKIAIGLLPPAAPGKKPPESRTRLEANLRGFTAREPAPHK